MTNQKNNKRDTLLKRKKKNVFLSFLKDISNNKFSYLIALPAIIYTLLFSYLSYPYFLTAFQKYSYTTNIFNSKWVGFKNFEFFFKSRYVITITLNTLYLNLLFIISGTIFAVLLALLLNEIRCKKFLRVSQSAMLFPSYVSWVTVSYILISIFSTEYGLMNKFLELIGAPSVNWYTKASAWPAILVIMRAWKGAGMSAVIYLAAITGIDGSIYEAASIDGAGRFHQIKLITIPLILPTITMLTLLNIGKIMYGDFGMMYAIIGDNGILFPTTDIIDTYVFRALRLNGDPAEAMAVGLFQSMIGFLMVAGANKLTKKILPEGTLY